MYMLSRTRVYLSIACIAMLAACAKTSQSSAQSTASPQSMPAVTATASAMTSASPATAPSVAAAMPSASASAPSASPSSSPSPSIAVAYTDINGIFAQQAITDEAELGIFGSPTGLFRPNAPVTRGDYVKWLVTANNIYFKDDPTQQLRFPETTEQTFVDVLPSNPYWKYVQALVDAGFIVGVDAKHFAPNRKITRQEMVAIKFQVDIGKKVTPAPGVNASELPEFADASQVSRVYITAIQGDNLFGSHNVARIWGKTAYLHPRQPLTRAEAAISLAQVNGNTAQQAVQAMQTH